MASVTIVTIIVIALLTAIVASLAWFAYSSCLKAYRIEVGHGQHDAMIREKYRPGKKGWGKGRIVGTIASYSVLALVLSLFAAGLAYRIKGEDLVINGQAALVIKSRSMSEFYDEALAEEYRIYGYDAGLQFDVGDICFFDTVPADAELVKGDVYGYRRKNMIITHRLTAEYAGGLYEFRGDNNPVSDGTLIPRDRVVYHYTGNKVPGIGAFALYAQSYFGIWSLSGIIGVTVGSEVAYHRASSIERKRYEEIGSGGEGHEE